jgi:hypothetical protein
VLLLVYVGVLREWPPAPSLSIFMNSEMMYYDDLMWWRLRIFLYEAEYVIYYWDEIC